MVKEGNHCSGILLEEYFPQEKMTILIYENKICRIVTDDYSVFTVNCIFTIQQFFRQYLTKYPLKFVVFEFGDFASTDTESRDFATQSRVPTFKAEAIIVKNLAQRILIRYYIQLMKKKGIVLGMFSNYEEAVSWLTSLEQ